MLLTERVSKDFDVPDTPLQDRSNSQLKSEYDRTKRY